MLAREGFDGSELHIRKRLIPGTERTQESTYRAHQGTFSWKYGRGQPGSKADMLFQAGSEFGRILERAGLDGPGTVDWAKAGYSAWKGLPPARLIALDEWKRLTQSLGKLPTARLVQFVVQGRTTAEMGKIYGMGTREAAFVVNADLMAVAEHFGYAGKRR